MKPSPTQGPPQSSQGIALVIVLAFLVLITGIILAFFSGVTTERSFSKTTADAANTQQLANSAVNIVMSQIVDATKGTETNGTMLSWASQPGMIRTYDTTGAAQNYYKLYSSDQMVVAGSSFSTANDVAPADWFSGTNIGIYADLNAPVLVADPNGAITSGSRTYSADYPIMDPSAQGKVDGFALTWTDSQGNAHSPPGYTGANPPAANYDPTASSAANPAPMPAKWLYVLSNGQVISPSGGVNGVLSFSGSTVPTLNNPIVGRVAFWSDDDTSKVNINTASEGVYWDTPRIFSVEDSGSFHGNISDALNQPGMAISQPAQYEYQRYPGHPATTCLSPVFGNYGLSVPYQSITGTTTSGTLWQPWTGTLGSPFSGTAQFNQYYALNPRENSGGSAAGTVLSGTIDTGATFTISGTAALVPKQDRLYASIDELMFTPQLTGSSRIPNTSSGSATPNVITKSVLEQTKFFITADSNAPEVTLFNTPRVSMWPEWDSGQIMASGSISVASGTTARTVFDNLAAFCGTITGTTGNSSTNTYYFTRANSRSDVYDASITRNQTLYQYLESLTGQSIPGFGGNFLAKYGVGLTGVTDRDQILTAIFDYIRCTNIADSTVTAGGGSYPFTPLFTPSGTNTMTPTSVYQDVQNLFPPGAGEVVPIKIQASSGLTMGGGRMLTICEADLLLTGTSYKIVGSGTQTNGMQAIFLLQLASPMQGMPGMRSSLKYTVSGLQSFQVSGTSLTGTFNLNLPSGGYNYLELSDVQTGGGRGIGGVEGPAESLYSLGGSGSGTSVKQLTTSGGNLKGNYPFFSSGTISWTPPAAPATGPRYLSFTGGNVVISLYTQDTNVLVQTGTIFFPSGTFPIPGYYPRPMNSRLTGGAVSGNSAVSNQGITVANALVSPYDVLIGIQPAGVLGNSVGAGLDPTAGDIRMTALLPGLPSTRFRPHNNYASGTGQFAHGMMTAGGDPYQSGTLYPSTAAPYNIQAGLNGELVPVPLYLSGNHNNNPTGKYGGYIEMPYVPSRVGTAVTHASASGGGPGDWDTGVGNTVDGAYMNKPDEGDIQLYSNVNGGVNQTVSRYPYQLGSTSGEMPPGISFFSPSRQVPSAMMLGSIPTGVQHFLPWQTLLFNPRPEDPNHPGLGTPSSGPPYTLPPDHLFADLFWMPVVQPYAISQPFSTAGKVNLNYQILPFTYIQRQTGLDAVMKATKFAAIPLTDGTSYKPAADSPATNENSVGFNPSRRRSINIPVTLQACDAKFANNDIYRSATQISEINLVPVSSGAEPAWTAANMAAFWNANKLTGTNLRDKPYVDIYPRLTTKSNTYTVHFYVQAIKQAGVNARKGTFIDPNGSAGSGKDTVLSEYRGSTTLERYVDPNDTTLPDFAAAVVSGSIPSIDPYYKFRVVSTKRFAP